MTPGGGTTGADDRMERVPERLPLFGETSPRGHISLHAVRVQDDEAFFQDTTARAIDEPDPAARTDCTVWVAVTHRPDGTRAYTGLGANARDVALEGRIDLGTLDARDRQSLRLALLVQDPDAWDRAPDEVHNALKDTGQEHPDP